MKVSAGKDRFSDTVYRVSCDAHDPIDQLIEIGPCCIRYKVSDPLLVCGNLLQKEENPFSLFRKKLALFSEKKMNENLLKSGLW